MAKCRCIRTATAADDRAYRAAINARGGPRSPGGRAYIDEQARLFRQTKHHCRQAHGPTADNGCALVLLAYGGTLTALAASIATVVHNLPI